MKLPYQIRKKMKIGGVPEQTISTPFPSLSSDTSKTLFQKGLIDDKGMIPTSIQKPNQAYSPTYGDLMYGANVGLMALSQNSANRQVQSSIDNQIGNPLINEQFNDERSSGVQYGYETFQQGGNIKNQNMNEHAILTAYLQQVPPNQRQGIMKQLAQLKQTNPQKYQQALQQLGEQMQQGQPQAKYGKYMQEGGQMDQQQDAAQQDPNAQQQGGDQQGQLIQQIAQMLQQGANPQQVVAQLVKMGVPQDQAMQLVQQVMQQMQQQPQQAPQMKMGGKYRKMY